MPNKTPLLLVTALALAATIAYLLQSRKHENDDDVNDLHLDDGSDDVTVQVKNGGRDDDVVMEDVHVESKKVDAASMDDSDEKMTALLDRSRLEEIQQQEEISIQQEAISKAATIIQSIPAVSLVDECIREVDAAESLQPPEVDTQKALDANISTIHEEESIPTTTEEEHIPIQLESPSNKKPFPKTPPVSLFSPSPDEEEIEPPTDTADYSQLKNYWKHQSDKHAFSPPRTIETEASSPLRPPTTQKKEKKLPRVSSQEDAAASAAVAGLMAAGVVNMLDQVYSPKTSHGPSFIDASEETMPLMDVSILDDDKKTDGEQLILESESPSSGSDKSGSDDYVKIVRSPSGDPISESALLSRPTAVEGKSEEGGALEELGESAAVVSVLDGDKSESNTAEGGGKEEAIVEGEVAVDEKAQTKSKSKSKKKKKGKKK
jgi:hypothetical protein